MDAATLVYDIDSSRARTAVTDLAKLNHESVKLARAFGQSDQAMRQANGRFASSADVARRYGDEVRALADKYNPALAAVYRFQQAEIEVNRAMALGVLTKKQAAAEIARLGREMNAVGATTSRVAGLFSGFGAQFIAFSAATFGIRQVATTLGGFEKSMAGVQAVTNATAQDMERLRDVAQRLGSTTEYTASQAAEGLRFLGMAGFSTAQSLEAIPAVLDLATAASMDLGSAADITSNIMSAFAIQAKDAASVADILAVAANSANTDVAQMGDAMSYVGPVAQSLGISLNDASAAIGALSNAGIQGSMAGTGLRRVLSSLANPTARARSELARLGVTLDEVNPQTNDIVDIIDRLAESGIDASAALQIFGDRGGPALLALVEQRQGLADLTRTMGDVEGAAGRMSGVMRDNLGGDFNSFTASVEGLILAMGDAGLTAALRASVQGMTGLVNITGGVVNAVGRVTGSAEAMASALAILAVTQLPRTVAATRAFIAANGLAAASSMTLTRAMQAQAVAATALSRAMALVGGPVGLALGGMAALGVHLVNRRRETKAMEDAFVSLSATVKDTSQALAAYRENQNLNTAQMALQAVTQEMEQIKALIDATSQSAISLETSLNMAEQIGGATQAMRDQAAEARSRLDELTQRYSILYSQQNNLNDMVEIFTDRLSGATAEADALADAQAEALADAHEMLRASTRRIELLRTEAQYGRDSAAVQVLQLRNERDIFAAKVNTLDVSDDIKRALMDTWEEEKRLEGATREWDHAMGILRDTAGEVYDAIIAIRDAEPGETWLDTAIRKAQTLGNTLWDALGQIGEGAPGMTSSARPRARPFELGVPNPPRGGGGRSSGGGGGRSAADQVREEMQRRWDALNEGFKAEFSLATAAYDKDQETLQWALDQKLISHQQYQQNLAMMRTMAFGSEWEQNALQYQMDQEALQSALDQKLISYEEYYRKLKELQFNNLISETNRSDMAQDLSNTARYFGMLQGMTSKNYNTLARLQQTFAAGAALVNAYLAASQTLADPTLGFWGKMAAYGKVLAAGLGLVQAIKGSGGASSSGSAVNNNPTAPAQQQPERTVLVNLQGEGWLVDMAEQIMTQIYEQSRDGRVIVARAN